MNVRYILKVWIKYFFTSEDETSFPSDISTNCYFNPTTLLLLKFQQCVLHKSWGIKIEKVYICNSYILLFLNGDTSYKKTYRNEINVRELCPNMDSNVLEHKQQVNHYLYQIHPMTMTLESLNWVFIHWNIL